MSASIHSRWRTSMNDARRKEIQRALTLIGEGKGILELALSQEQEDLDNMPEDLQGDEVGQIAEDVVDALEGAAMGCGDAITACKEAMQQLSFALFLYSKAEQKERNDRVIIHASRARHSAEIVLH